MVSLISPEVTVRVLANKGAIAERNDCKNRDHVGVCTIFLTGQAIKILNKGSIEFANDSKVVAGFTTSSSSIRGMSINLLYLDEFAFVDECRYILYCNISRNHLRPRFKRLLLLLLQTVLVICSIRYMNLQYTDNRNTNTL